MTSWNTPEQLAELLRDTPCKINLIPFNPFPNSGYKRPSNNRVYRFRDYLQSKNYIVTIRSTRGDDIDAACGQLVGRVEGPYPPQRALYQGGTD